MLWDILIVSIITPFILHLIHAFNAYKARRFKITEPLNEYFNNHKNYDTNNFQQVIAFEGSTLFHYLVSIHTLKKTFNPLSMLLQSNEKLIFKGLFKKNLNTVIFKKTKGCKLPIIDFLLKQKSNDRSLTIYGNLQMLEFVKKYEIELFYVTTLPEEYKAVKEYSTIFFLEMDADKVDEMFIAELFSGLYAIPDSGSEKAKELTMKYENKLGTIIMKENIKSREEELSKVRVIDEDKRRKKHEKKGRIVIK